MLVFSYVLFYRGTFRGNLRVRYRPIGDHLADMGLCCLRVRGLAILPCLPSPPSPTGGPLLGCAFRRNSGGIPTECGKRHRPERNVTGTGTGMCYNTILDIPVYEVPTGRTCA
jgi:hypothetical protein